LTTTNANHIERTLYLGRANVKRPSHSNALDEKFHYQPPSFVRTGRASGTQFKTVETPKSKLEKATLVRNVNSI